MQGGQFYLQSERWGNRPCDPVLWPSRSIISRSAPVRELSVDRNSSVPHCRACRARSGLHMRVRRQQQSAQEAENTSRDSCIPSVGSTGRPASGKYKKAGEHNSPAAIFPTPSGGNQRTRFHRGQFLLQPLHPLVEPIAFARALDDLNSRMHRPRVALGQFRAEGHVRQQVHLAQNH
jgi:hypothetical protein